MVIPRTLKARTNTTGVPFAGLGLERRGSLLRKPLALIPLLLVTALPAQQGGLDILDGETLWAAGGQAFISQIYRTGSSFYRGSTEVADPLNTEIRTSRTTLERNNQRPGAGIAPHPRVSAPVLSCRGLQQCPWKWCSAAVAPPPARALSI